MFDYGVIVCWGLSEQEERAVLDRIRPYETEPVSECLFMISQGAAHFWTSVTPTWIAKLESDEVEKEDFVFFYNVRALPQIYNDIITLRKPSNVKHKLASTVSFSSVKQLSANSLNSNSFENSIPCHCAINKIDRVRISS